MGAPYTLYSDKASGAVAVEAALTLIGQPYDLVEAATSDPEQPRSGDRVLAVNPMRQVPALVAASGEVLTESAAILLWLTEQHPQAALAPASGDPARGQFLRWMSYVSSAIYSLYWVKDTPSRLVPDPGAQDALVARTLERIAECWGVMESHVAPGRYILGDRLTVLDLYVTVVSRFRPRRRRFYAVAPRLGEVARRVDADPRLQAMWSARYPFEDDWEG